MISHLYDSSAALAYIFEEKGATEAEKYLIGSSIAAINLSEVAQKIAFHGVSEIPQLHSLFNVIPLDADLAYRAAKLYLQTQKNGLSLADRVCIATAIKFKLPIVTADKAWYDLKLGVKIISIR